MLFCFPHIHLRKQSVYPIRWYLKITALHFYKTKNTYSFVWPLQPAMHLQALLNKRPFASTVFLINIIAFL